MPSTTFLKYSSWLSMNLIKIAFGKSSSSSFSVISSQSLKVNTSSGTDGVNLSERCYLLHLIISCNNANGLPFPITSNISFFDILWPHLSIICHYFYFAYPQYSLLHLQIYISPSWCLFYYTFVRCVVKTTHLILRAYRSYLQQSEVVTFLVTIMSTLSNWFLKLPLIKKYSLKHVNFLFL